jgi:hypothetical protein
MALQILHDLHDLAIIRRPSLWEGKGSCGHLMTSAEASTQLAQSNF